jgi:hypothetical protein
VCEIWSLALREKHILQVFDSRVLREIFGFKGYEGSGQLGYYIMRNFVFH